MVVITNSVREAERQRERGVIIFLVAILFGSVRFCLYAIKSTHFPSHDHCAWWCRCTVFHIVLLMILFVSTFSPFAASVFFCAIRLLCTRKKYVDIVIIHSHTHEQTSETNIPIRFKEGQKTNSIPTVLQFEFSILKYTQIVRFPR